MPKQKRPRKHHYVPRFLIKRFADERGKVNAYDRVTRTHLRDQSPGQVLVNRDLYRMKNAQQDEQFFLEELFSKGETQWAVTIEDVVKRGNVLTGEMSTLSEFLAIQYARTYRMKDEIRAMTRFYSTGIGVLDLQERLATAEFDGEERKTAEEFIRDVNAGNYRLSYGDDFNLALQFIALPEMVNRLTTGWQYIVISLAEPLFVLTDCPIALIGDWPGDISMNIGIGNALEVWTPVDPSHALVLTRDMQLPPHVLLPVADARNLNKRLAMESLRWTLYRPGTTPLKKMKIPKQSPEIVVDDLVMIDPATGEPKQVAQHARERVNIVGERLLSGRLTRPFPPRRAKRMKGKTWLPDDDPGGPVSGLHHLPADLIERWQPIGRISQ